MPFHPVRSAAVLLALSAFTAACSSGAPEATTASLVADAPSAPSVVELATPSPSAAPVQAASRARAAVPVAPVAKLTARITPDVLVRANRTMSDAALAKLAALVPAGRSTVFRAGEVTLKGAKLSAVGIDPSSFRAFAADKTAEADAVWQAVARGEAVASHAVAKSRALGLGREVEAQPVSGAELPAYRLGALATTGIPGTDLVVDDANGRELGLPASTGMVLSVGEDADPVEVAAKVRAITGDGARVDLLTPPKANPIAFLTGSKAAKAFGAFSYRYFPDGTIQPDASWVRTNIRSETVPIFGRVTCHRLMLPQLRGALQEVVDRGLADTLKTYDGCYVPRFIERNPENSISLHTWGIAIDLDASTNYRGIAGTMDPEVVAIFKRWGFRWGGDWKYTDPMHFEMGAIIQK